MFVLRDALARVIGSNGIRIFSQVHSTVDNRPHLFESRSALRIPPPQYDISFYLSTTRDSGNDLELLQWKDLVNFHDCSLDQ